MFVLIVSVVLFMTPIIKEPKPQFLIGLAFILSAFVVYIPFVYQKKRLAIVGTYHFCVVRGPVYVFGFLPNNSEGGGEDGEGHHYGASVFTYLSGRRE